MSPVRSLPTRPFSATYRMQVHADFDFADAARQLDYLADLGVSHLYLSPILQAAPGSTHGYDVVDHRAVSAQLGGAQGLRELVAAAHDRGLGLVVDLVPNHMSVPTPAYLNEPLWELLRDGRDSRYAAWFDVDWQAGGDTILMPVLGEPLQDALALGQLTLAANGGRGADEWVVRYHEHELPVRPGTQDLPLPELLDAQWWCLAHWKSADLGLNYRRFFDVQSLVAVRVEDPAVFAETHELLVGLVRDRSIDGLRIDHPDGLADPRGYLRMLDAATEGAWVVVEKILEGEERLPVDWPVAGTTGYDALRFIGGVFLDPSGAKPLLATLAVLTGDAREPHELAREAKMQVGLRVQAAEIARLVRLLGQFTAGRPDLGEIRPEAWRRAVSALLVSLDRYRVYVHPGEPASDESVGVLHAATDRARELLAVSDEPVLELVGDLALGRQAAAGTDEAEAARTEFVLRFQQTTGPIQAKGVEDTGFYRWFHLTALNEVGCDLGEFGCSPAHLDRFAKHLAAHWPESMTTLSTHDTKRSEDTRARLAPISELPVQWSEWMHTARELAAGARPPQVDAATEYLLWQTIVGTWPATTDRLVPYAVKAAREACVHTSWVDSDAAYEAALGSFLEWALSDAQVGAHVECWLARTAPHVRAVTLGQKLLQLVLPGVPDVYQGCELVTRTLVDPDNRRPVDFAERAQRLARLDSGAAPADLADEKLWVTACALRLRRRHPDWFGAEAAYEMLGTGSEHAIAVARGTGERHEVVAVATRLVEGLQSGGGWAGARLTLPEGSWSELLSGRSVVAGRGGTLLGQLLGQWPVALLVRGA